MMTRPALAVSCAAALATLAACAPQTPRVNSLVQGAVPLGPYYIVGIGHDAVPERNASIVLANGVITGSGPCNAFTATNAAPLPAIQITNFQPGYGACDAQAFENRFFGAIQSAQSADYVGGVLTVKGATWLTFEAGTRGN